MFVLVVVLGLVALLVARQWRSRMRLPKGPMPFPIIGNLPQIVYGIFLTGTLVGALRHIQKQYGKVFTVWLGPQPSVHIADYDVAHEVMVKQGSKYATRFVPELMSELRNGNGVIVSNGSLWLEHRRFALHTLRNFGLGRNIMEDRIMDELNARFAELDRDAVGGVSLRRADHFFDLIVGSIINSILLSERFSEDDKVYKEMKQLMDSSIESLTFFDTLIPLWLLKSPLLHWRYEKTMKPTRIILSFLDDQVTRRVDDIKAGKHHIADEPEDYVDAFLQKMKKDENDNVKDSTFHRENLAVTLLDLWLAGQETTSTTLLWATLLLLNNPNEIVKIRNEVTKVTGDGSRHLSLTDRRDTPYLNGAISEIIRITPILNINLWRLNTEDTMVDGQPMEAGAIVTAQLSLILSDEGDFKDSTKFDPSRFVRDESLHQHVIPFGIGKRSCLGESLARAELYLILGNMLLRYDMQADGVVPDLKPRNPLGVLNRPKNCKIRFVKIAN